MGTTKAQGLTTRYEEKVSLCGLTDEGSLSLCGFSGEEGILEGSEAHQRLTRRLILAPHEGSDIQ